MSFKDRECIWILLVVSSALRSTSGESVETTITRSSPACQATVKVCIEALHAIDPTAGTNCKTLQSTFNSVSAYQCLVLLGLCLENEYNVIKQALCGGSYKNETSSAVKQSVYQEMNGLPIEALAGFVNCVLQLPMAAVFKQQEQFCALFKVYDGTSDFERCLSRSKEDASEFKKVHEAACKNAPTASDAITLSGVILEVSVQCRAKLEECTRGEASAVLVRSEQYCKLMDSSQGGITITKCLSECTSNEIAQLRDVACSGSPVLSTWSTLVIIVAAVLFHYKL